MNIFTFEESHRFVYELANKMIETIVGDMSSIPILTYGILRTNDVWHELNMEPIKWLKQIPKMFQMTNYLVDMNSNLSY